MDLDSIIKEIGQFGKYQRWIYLLLFFPFLHHSICSLSYVFTAADLKYRCRVPECDGNNTEFDVPWLRNGIPHNSEGIIINQCERYKPIEPILSNNCSADGFFSKKTEHCETYIFETAEISMSKEFNLLCEENTWKRTLVGTMNNAAQFIGLPISGVLSDRYGRKLVTTLSVTLSAILGTFRSFSSNYLEFIILEMLDAMASAGVYCVIFILGIEIIGPDMRGFCGVLIGVYYPMGTVILGLAAWLVNDWRQYLRILYLPGLLFISYFWLLPESFRWLIAKGKRKEAVEVIKGAAITNGRVISDETNIILDKLEKNLIELKEGEQSKNPFREVISSKIVTLWIANSSYCWITHTFVFYGISLTSVAIAGNKYLNFIVASLIEVPAYFIAWYAVDSLGRRLTVVFGLFLCGVSCCAFSFVPYGEVVIKFILFMTGKFGITISFTGFYILTSELFPTKLRNSLMGFCSTLGRIGSMIAPQAPMIAIYCDPVLVFGCASVLAGLLALYFPETLHQKLPDTLEEAEELGRGKRRKTKADIKETEIQ